MRGRDDESAVLVDAHREAGEERDYEFDPA
jgi:hypothetical protein